MSATVSPEAWARFEAMLRTMRAGDVITVDGAVDETGIGEESAALVLESLVRADLFERHEHQFIRVSLFGDAELRRAIGAHVRRRNG